VLSNESEMLMLWCADRVIGSVSIVGYDTRWTWVLGGGNRGFAWLFGQMDDVVAWDLPFVFKEYIITHQTRTVNFIQFNSSFQTWFFNFVFYSLKSSKYNFKTLLSFFFSFLYSQF